MDYFMLQQFLSELEDSKFVTNESSDKKHDLVITDAGKNTLNYFINHIPKSKIEHIDQLLNVQKEKFILDAQVTADYVKLKDNEYLVKLKVTENDLLIVNLELGVTSNKQAKQICKRWLENTPNLYNQIINMLVE